MLYFHFFLISSDILNTIYSFFLLQFTLILHLAINFMRCCIHVTPYFIKKMLYIFFVVFFLHLLRRLQYVPLERCSIRKTLIKKNTQRDFHYENCVALIFVTVQDFVTNKACDIKVKEVSTTEKKTNHCVVFFIAI